MGKVNERLEEIIRFLELEEGYDRGELLADILGEIESLKGHYSDEIALIWDDEILAVLNDFVNDFYNKLIEKICNAINTFKD